MGGKAYTESRYNSSIQERASLLKIFEAFRFDPQLYVNFKELASKNGYTSTSALKKFMADSVQFGACFSVSQK
jgi:hypothetical protein